VNKFGKVAVLMGGISGEREISLSTGKAVFDALLASGVDAVAVDTKDDVLKTFHDNKFDRAFNALHGGHGENGAMQGFLEVLGIPFTGCGVWASAITMNKVDCKIMWQHHGLPVVPWRVVGSLADKVSVIDALGLPMAIKPASEGSSLGVSKVNKAEEFDEAFKLARSYEEVVVAEPWIGGREMAMPINNGVVYPAIDIKTPREFYDYEAKYVVDTTDYVCPCALDGDIEKRMQDIAVKAYATTRCEGVVRADFKVEGDKVWLFELNTMPGLTEKSLVPKSAKVFGLSFQELVLGMLEETL
jgi:D-alanine-D-alanine ligase